MDNSVYRAAPGKASHGLSGSVEYVNTVELILVNMVKLRGKVYNFLEYKGHRHLAIPRTLSALIWHLTLGSLQSPARLYNSEGEWAGGLS